MEMDTGTIFFGSNRNKPNSICFGSVSTFFAKLKQISVCFGVSKPFRNEPKQKIGVSKQTLQIITLLCYGHGRGYGLGHFSFVSVCFVWCFGYIETPKQFTVTLAFSK